MRTGRHCGPGRRGPSRLQPRHVRGRAALSPDAAWISADPDDLVRRVVDLGVRRLLLLDLSRVGTGSGTGTEALLSRLSALHPRLEISVGGGISGLEEIHAIRDQAGAAVLVGSALHNGRIGGRELDQLRSDR